MKFAFLDCMQEYKKTEQKYNGRMIQFEYTTLQL